MSSPQSLFQANDKFIKSLEKAVLILSVKGTYEDYRFFLHIAGDLESTLVKLMDHSRKTLDIHPAIFSDSENRYLEEALKALGQIRSELEGLIARGQWAFNSDRQVCALAMAGHPISWRVEE